MKLEAGNGSGGHRRRIGPRLCQRESLGSGQGLKVAIFDIDTERGPACAEEVGGTFHHVDITDEQSVEDGFAAARAAHGQERVTVHCAMTSRRGKTLGWDKENGRYKRLSTEDYAYGAEGILVSSYRIASHSALGMANSEPLNEDGERGAIVLTASVAAQDGQIGQVIYGSCKSGVNGLVLPMARDLMDMGIRVNSVMPGIFATPLMLGMKDRNPQMWDQLNASRPLPQTARPSGGIRQPDRGDRPQHLHQWPPVPAGRGDPNAA